MVDLAFGHDATLTLQIDVIAIKCAGRRHSSLTTGIRPISGSRPTINCRHQVALASIQAVRRSELNGMHSSAIG